MADRYEPGSETNRVGGRGNTPPPEGVSGMRRLRTLSIIAFVCAAIFFLLTLMGLPTTLYAGFNGLASLVAGFVLVASCLIMGILGIRAVGSKEAFSRLARTMIRVGYVVTIVNAVILVWCFAIKAPLTTTAFLGAFLPFVMTFLARQEWLRVKREEEERGNRPR